MQHLIMLQHAACTSRQSIGSWAGCLQGTPGLIYGPAVDLWSVGIVLFILLGGAHSFCMQRTVRAEFAYKPPYTCFAMLVILCQEQ